MTETPAPADALRALDARLRAHAFGATENHEPKKPRRPLTALAPERMDTLRAALQDLAELDSAGD